MRNRKYSGINKKLLFILTLICIGSIGINMFFLKSRNNTKLISENIDKQIMKIAEIATVKYNYTDVVSYENAKQFSGLDIPFTNKQFIAKYSGYIKAGLNFNDIKIEAKDDSIEVSLPKAEIVDNVIIEESITFFDEKDGLFNKLNYDELYDVLKEVKLKTEQKVIKNGIINEAEKNAEDVIRLMLLDSGVEDSNIKIIQK